MNKLLRGAAVCMAAAITLAGCSTGSSDESSEESTSIGTEPTDEFPVAIEHVYGETTVEEAPQRVATVGWVTQDLVLALGTVPVGMPSDEYGGNENASTPWKDEALAELGAEIGGDNAPVQYSEADGINFNAVADTTPDLILAVASGITQEEYDKLSEIAPVVAFPEVAFGTAWQDSTMITGKALGKSEAAEKLVADTEEAVTDAVAEHPQIADKTYIASTIDPAAAEAISIFISVDSRPRFLESLGMSPAPVIVEAEKSAESSFYMTWSAEKASELNSDVLLTWSTAADSAEAIAADPLLSQIPAVQNDSLITVTDETLSLAVSAVSPLSLPYALEQYLPLIADAVDKSSA